MPKVLIRQGKVLRTSASVRAGRNLMNSRRVVTVQGSKGVRPYPRRRADRRNVVLSKKTAICRNFSSYR